MSDSIEVTVSGVVLSYVDKDKNEYDGKETIYELMVGESIILKYEQFGDAQGNGAQEWTCTDTSIAYVSGGRLTGRVEDEEGVDVTLSIASKTSTSKSYTSNHFHVKVVRNTSGIIVERTMKAGNSLPFEGSVCSDLNSECRTKTARLDKESPLDYITNVRVSTGQGTLYYNYMSASDHGSGVGSEKYYYEPVRGQRGIEDITFVPLANFSGEATITFTAYSKNKQTLNGTIHVTVDEIDDVAYETRTDTPITFQTSDFSNICHIKTGRELSYVTFELPSASRGTLYYNYTGSEVYPERVTAGSEYYTNRTPTLERVTFLPAEGWTGTLRINYKGVDTSGTTYSGKVSITVTGKNGTGSGDVNYSASPGRRVSFRSADFDDACQDAIGERLDYVRFDLPSSSKGVLYYNYRSTSDKGTRVSASTNYYRSGGSRLISNISFVPDSSSTGNVSIDFTAYGDDGGRFDGTVFIRYEGNGSGDDIVYSTRAGRTVEFVAADFNDLCQDANDRSLNYIRFDNLPSTSRGTLYYNYSSNSSKGSKVSTSTRLYRSGTNTLSRVAFIPASGYTGTVSLDFTGYDTAGDRFTGTVRIEVEDGSQVIRYSVYSGQQVRFEASDFNTACEDATGDTLSYVRFEPPSTSRGTLYYKYGQSGSGTVSSSTSYYRTGNSRLLDDVSFVAASGYAGTVEIPYTGRSTGNESFNGRVQVQVNTSSAGVIRYSGSADKVIAFHAAEFRTAAAQTLPQGLSYIQFTSLPSTSQGQLYLNYHGSGTGSRVLANTSYYPSGSPSLDDMSFVPNRSYSGTVSIPFDAMDTAGTRVTGSVQITVTPAQTFTDMGSYSWASSAVEYLYRNDIVSGVGGSRFGPSQSIRRGDFVLMLCKAFQLDTGSTSSFSDVPSNSYYARAIATARDLGIAAGSNGRFQPNSTLSRQDAVVMLRAAMLAAGRSIPGSGAVDLSRYRDGSQVADYARSAMATMIQMKAISGTDDQRLKPRDPISRAEMAVVLYRVLTA